MRNKYSFMLGLCAMAMASGVNAQTAMQQVEKQTGLDFEKSRRHRGKGKNNRRGKGQVSRPAKKPNRLTISKRVRNKHRKAARS